MKFNKPPWDVCDYYEYDDCMSTYPVLGVYDVYPEDKVTKESHEYNKRLITIAPLMYQLLEKMLRAQEKYDNEIGDDLALYDVQPTVADFFYEIHRLVCSLNESPKFDE